MKYEFKDIFSRAKVALETDSYIIYHTVKSKIYYSGNYLQMKKLPQNIDDLDNYIQASRKFFQDKGVNFIHIALPENMDVDKKLKKYLIKENFNEIVLDLYSLHSDDYNEEFKSNFSIEELKKLDYSKYLEFQYEIDIELGNEEWAKQNQEFLYNDIKSDNISQIIVKSEDNIVGTVNIIEKDDYIEIDNLYVDKKYRKRGIATDLIRYVIKKFNKRSVILVADFNDTVRFMYERMGFKLQSRKIYWLKTNN